MLKRILRELASHGPFTLLGALGGVAILLLFHFTRMPEHVSHTMFEIFHPLHVVLSALVTAGVYRLYKKANVWKTIVIGVVGAIGIGTLSDCLMPWLGEVLLGMEHAEGHIGFIDLWYFVWPGALLGVGLAWVVPYTRVPHAGHVLLSTAASLFHILMAKGEQLQVATIVAIPFVLALAVWVPCCTSDIIFPLLFVGKDAEHVHGETHSH